MPYLETVGELAEGLADLCGIYSQGLHFIGMTREESRAQTEWIADHADDCTCRACWTEAMARRIRAAVANEQRLKAGGYDGADHTP